MKRSTTSDTTQAFEAALLAEPDGQRFCLRLFITGTTPRSTRAVRNIRAICEEHLPGRYDLEVIDIYQHPEYAKPEQIVVTPTLFKKLPLPFRKMIGDLSNKDQVLIGLGIVRHPVPVRPVEKNRGT